MKKIFSVLFVAAAVMLGSTSCKKSGDGAANDSTKVDSAATEQAEVKNASPIVGVWLYENRSKNTLSEYVFNADGTYTKYDYVDDKVTGEKGKYSFAEADKKLTLTPEGGEEKVIDCEMNGTSQVVINPREDAVRYNTKKIQSINAPSMVGTWKSGDKYEVVLNADKTCSVKLEGYEAEGTYDVICCGLIDKLIVTDKSGATKVLELSINDSESTKFSMERPGSKVATNTGSSSICDGFTKQ